MQFYVIDRNIPPPNAGINSVYLKIDNWNDFSFVTLFHVSLHDEKGVFHKLGSVKIGFKGQVESVSTHSTLPRPFVALPDSYFSVGTEVDYYSKLKNELPEEFSNTFLASLRDIVFDQTNFDNASGEKVLSTSLLRDVSLSVIKGQFRRVLDGGTPLTNFKFMYHRPQTEKIGLIELHFHVEANSKPSTNIHAIIGRNGVGKTTILNGMIEAITNKAATPSRFYDTDGWRASEISKDYFSSLVSVSFSAFDPFTPPPEQPDPALGTCYYYIGLKDSNDHEGTKLKTLPDLRREFADFLVQCFSQPEKKKRWLTALSILQSDDNFAQMGLEQLATISATEEQLRSHAISLMRLMSSGHAVVLLTLTKLVSTVEEKTLVLVDEPESHLHPPLLSAFTRALSQLLHNRNGVAIIATHSPVVLQEIPKSCVWKVTRSRLATSTSRPETETFGENVGVLTREVFGLEVVKSGFHTLLADEVKRGASYDDIIAHYQGQLGFEAKAILRSMILERDLGGQIQ